MPSQVADNSIAKLLKSAIERLKAVSDTPALDCEILLIKALNQGHLCQPDSEYPNYSRAYLRAWPEYELNHEQYQLFKQLLQQRLEGKPIAYITGHKEFWSLELAVNDSTLIPRPDTETLVAAALQEIPIKGNWNILDLGTGSGAIALAIASERPNSQVFAMDYSYPAINTAQQNAKRLQLDNVYFFCANWLQALSNRTFQLIVSNPPYIQQEDPHLKQGDVRFEPLTALASGKDGLADIKQILKQARSHLEPGSKILLEHGYDQADAVEALLKKNHYRQIQQHTDLSGIIRVSSGQV